MYKARMWIVLASVMLTAAGQRFSGTTEAESGTTQQLYRQCRDRYTDAYAALQTKLLEYRQSIGQ